MQQWSLSGDSGGGACAVTRNITLSCPHHETPPVSLLVSA